MWPWKWGQGHQNLIISSLLQIMCLCKFRQNPPIGPGDIVQTRSYTDADADGIRTKSNMSPSPRLGGWGEYIACTPMCTYGLYLLLQKYNFDTRNTKYSVMLTSVWYEVGTGNQLCKHIPWIKNCRLLWARFLTIDAFWLDNNAEMKINFISYKCKNYFSLNSYTVYCQMHLYCAVLDQKIE